jgi:hypothetical protein
MAQDPDVKRVIAALKRAAAKADTANRAATARAAAAETLEADTEVAARAANDAWGSRTVFSTSGERDAIIAVALRADDVFDKARVAAHEAHAAWGDAESAADDADDDLSSARTCRTLKDLLESDRLAVREAALFALNPAPPAPKRTPKRTP